MLAQVLAARLARNGVHYGWVMVGLTFLIAMSTAATMGLPGVLIDPLKTEFGWQTAEISGPLGLRLMLFGLVAPFAAALMARYGILRVVSAALLRIALGVGWATVLGSLPELWASWGVLVGLGTGLTAMVLGATVASRWFTKRRGLVVGMLTAANATGQLLFLPLDAWIAQSYGWRMAVVPPMVACLVAFVLLLLLGRDYPAQLGLRGIRLRRVLGRCARLRLRRCSGCCLGRFLSAGCRPTGWCRAISFRCAMISAWMTWRPPGCWR